MAAAPAGRPPPNPPHLNNIPEGHRGVSMQSPLFPASPPLLSFGIVALASTHHTCRRLDPSKGRLGFRRPSLFRQVDNFLRLCSLWYSLPLPRGRGGPAIYRNRIPIHEIENPRNHIASSLPTTWKNGFMRVHRGAASSHAPGAPVQAHPPAASGWP